MKIIFSLLTVLFIAAIAQADRMKPAYLELRCTGQKRGDVIGISSNKLGTVVTVNNVKIIEQESQLIAGTEGGPPYVQAVGGGYNITISGGDFERAFYTSSIVGKASASISIYKGVATKIFNSVCRGSFAF